MMGMMRFAAVVALATIFAGMPALAQEPAPAPAVDLQTARCADFNGAADESPYVAYVEGFASARGSEGSSAAHLASVRQACASQPEVGFLSMVTATAPAPLAAVGPGQGPTSCTAPPTSTCNGCSVSCEAGKQAVCRSGRDFGSVRCATRARCACE